MVFEQQSAVRFAAHELHLSPPAGRGRIASAIRVRGSIRKGGDNHLKHAGHVDQHIVVPEAQDAVIMLSEPFVANYISQTIGMLSAVDLNNQTRLAADEIDSVGSDWLLPDKLMSAEPTRSQSVPKCVFGTSRISTQPPRAISFNLFGTAQVASPPHPACFARRPLPARGERLPLTGNA
jgi:hypothetical protein